MICKPCPPRARRVITFVIIAVLVFVNFPPRPDMSISDGLLHKEYHSSVGSYDRFPGGFPSRPKSVPSPIKPVAVHDQEASADAQHKNTQHPPSQAAATKPPSIRKMASGPERNGPHNSVAYLEPPLNPRPDEATDADIDWSRLAYTQYVTDSDYLCNSVMMFEALNRLGTKADLVMLYPQEMLPDPHDEVANDWDGQLIITARDKYHVKLVPITIQSRLSVEVTWADSYTKLLAFNQTQYDRVLNLDSDGVILGLMDELFLTPPCTVAMPRAYWLLHEDPPQRVLSSQIMLVTPSAVEFERLQVLIDGASGDQFDMEIVNRLYLDSAMILPHRKYDLLTGEYRSKDHAAYLGSDREEWDAKRVLNEAKFVHFSDWPVPKPWIPMTEEERLMAQPECRHGPDEIDCTDREIWNGFYDDYLKERQRICYDIDV